MTVTTAPFTPRNPAVTAALVVAAGGAATILGALFFQYGLGLPPCPLCLEQRVPYYVGIPLAVIIAVAAYRDAPRPLVVAGLGVLALVFLFGAGLAAYHAGIEWKWWPGPQDCSGPLNPLGSRHLLEVNPIPSIDRFPEVRDAYCDFVVAWLDQDARSLDNPGNGAV